MSLVVNYPKFLENVALPLMQPAVAKLLHELECPSSALIAEYVCPEDQVETQGMIAFFKKEIPPGRMKLVKKQTPEVSGAFDEIPCKNEDLFPGSIPIKNSTVRRLSALAAVYFGYKCRLHLVSLGLNVSLDDVEPNQEYSDFLGRIPGITIVQKCDPKKDLRVCHTLVFGDFAWYKTVDPNAKLLLEPKRVLDFLQSKGFKKSTTPSQGQVVVYHTATQTNHFARILRVESDRTVIVQSKFGSFHVYEHTIGLAQYYYGNSVTFLNPPR